MFFQRRWRTMDFKERWYLFGNGNYNECEGAFFIWVLTTALLHYGRRSVRVEIAWPFEPSKSMYVKNMILLFLFLFLYNGIFYNYFLNNVLFIVQYHYPFLVHGCVNHDFPQDLWCAISKLSAFVHWITSKEVHMSRIPWWCQEIVEIVRMFEKELPMSSWTCRFIF